MGSDPRRAEGYEPRFDLDLSYGQQAERVVLDIIDGLQTQRTEVKRDGVAVNTKHLYIETDCERADGWHCSGIDATTAEWWFVMVSEMHLGYVFSTQMLRRLVTWGREHGYEQTMRRGARPTRGVCMPVVVILELVRMFERADEEAKHDDG